MAPSRDVMHAARRALGIDELVLTVHDASFPSRPDEDTGRGSPYGFGAEDLITFADALGFTGLQLGPQGETTRFNRSPYDGTVFAKSSLSIALQRLARDPTWEGLLEEGTVAATVDGAPGGEQVAHDYAYDAQRQVLDRLFTNFELRGAARLHDRLRAFEAGAHEWLPHDALYEARAFCARHGRRPSLAPRGSAGRGGRTGGAPLRVHAVRGPRAARRLSPAAGAGRLEALG